MIIVAWAFSPAFGQTGLTPLADMVLDGSALLFASNATYGRAINGLAFQTEALRTVGDYEYSSAQGYEFTGAGIQGRGGLTVAGGNAAGSGTA